MKKIFYSLSLVMMISMYLFSCKKTEKLDPSTLPFLGGDTWVNTPIDDWISQNLTKPYNMQVKYKFDQFEADVQRTLVPIKEELVVPSLQAMVDVFIQPYVDIRGADFMKTNVPKEVVYVGSPSYNTNGTITLGQAEGGKKILLLDMNTFSLANKSRFIRMMHTMHHEFGHILNQKIPYNPDFQLISKQDYTGNWNQISMEEANAKGFVTPYAMSAHTEDFVEIVSTMLSEGEDYYEGLINAQPAEVQSIFRRKEQMVADYYKNIWGIDLYELQKVVQSAIDVYFPSNPVAMGAISNSSDVFFTNKNASGIYGVDFNKVQDRMKNSDQSVFELAQHDGVCTLTECSFVPSNNTYDLAMLNYNSVTDAIISAENNAMSKLSQLQPLLGDTLMKISYVENISSGAKSTFTDRGYFGINSDTNVIGASVSITV